MKVLFFPYWPGNPYQPNLIKFLTERGALIVWDERNTLPNLELLSLDQNILHIHWTHLYLFDSTLYRSIKKSIRFIRFIASAKWAGAKLVWTVHNLGEHEKKFPVFERYMHRLFARLVDAMIVHSQYAKGKVVDAYRLERSTKKVHVIPHGHYIDNYPNNISGEEARAGLNISRSKKVFLFCGAIRSYKGLPELIFAFKKISSGNELLILAGRPFNEKIKAEISSLVRGRDDILFFPEFIADERIQMYMNAADAVVFPFRDIFTSGSILLAMSFAKTIVVPKIESLSDIIASGGAVTFDQENEDGLACALKKVLCSDIEKLGRLSFGYAQKFSWEPIANDTYRLYESCLSGNS